MHGVALPDSLLHHSFFLQGPWYDHSKSVQLPDGLMMNLVTGSDGLPQTLVTAINSMHLSITPLVLLTSGWGRGDVGNMIHGGPFAWPAPSDPSSFLGPGYNPLQFLLFTKDSDDSCTEYCPLGARVIRVLCKEQELEGIVSRAQEAGSRVQARRMAHRGSCTNISAAPTTCQQYQRCDAEMHRVIAVTSMWASSCHEIPS